MPPPVRHVVNLLVDHCRQQRSRLILFGSRAHGKTGLGADWDFGIESARPTEYGTWVTLKRQCEDASFPHRVDLVDLTCAPAWLTESIGEDYVVLYDPS